VTDYVISVDLGQAGDFSALSVLHRKWRRYETEVNRWPLYHEIPLMERWALHTAYPVIVEAIEKIYHFVETKSEMGVRLVVDQGGPGRPVIDLLRQRKLRPVGVTITAGLTVGVKTDGELTCPKRDICAALVVAAQSGDLKVASGLELASEFEKEVEAFGYTINRKTGNMGYESIVNEVHDDLVVSAAMGLWYSTAMLSKAFPITDPMYVEGSDLDYNPLRRQRA